MNYTRSQLHERISDLSGQFKAAQENKRLTSEKLAEQGRLADLARQADEKADALLAEVVAQLRDAKASYADAVEEIIAVPGAPIASEEVPGPGLPASNRYVLPEEFGSIFTEGADFQAQALENGAARITDAFNEATR